MCIIALPLIYGSLSTNMSRTLSNECNNIKSKRIAGHITIKSFNNCIQDYEAVECK